MVAPNAFAGDDASLSAAAVVDPPVADPSISAASVADAGEKPPNLTSPRRPVSERKRAANRANAKKSTGPRTAAGKVRAASNAVKHGLYAQSPLFPFEDPGALRDLCDEFCGEYEPVGPLERGLAERLVALTWRLRRIAAAEDCVATGSSFSRLKNHYFKAACLKPYGMDKPPYVKSEPPEESCGAQILADSMCGDQSSRLQQLALLDLRIGGHYLSTIRQFGRAREQRLKEERDLLALELEARDAELDREQVGKDAPEPTARRAKRKRRQSKPETDLPEADLADAEPFPWEIEQQQLAEQAAADAERQGELEAWKRAIEVARAEGEAAGRMAALAERSHREAEEAEPEKSAGTNGPASASNGTVPAAVGTTPHNAAERNEATAEAARKVCSSIVETVPQAISPTETAHGQHQRCASAPAQGNTLGKVSRDAEMSPERADEREA